jgi:predicted DsbA family dithiol-disulfide isomerase
MAKGGMARRAYLEGLFGSRAKAVEAHVGVIQMAEEIGLPLDLGAIDRTPNTFDAHRLIHWAGLEQLADPVMEGLMAAYWAEGRDIGAAEVLVDVAQKAGMDPALTARLLATDADRDAIIARESHARERGISAAPTFIIDNAHAISGAQPVMLWRDVIAELLAREAAPETGDDLDQADDHLTKRDDLTKADD